MEREAFAQRFRDASAKARDFARECVEEPLPDAMVFRVRLNASYDGHALHADERTFPEDDVVAVARTLRTSDEVVQLLWRGGLVPEWVNLDVVGEIGDATVLEVVSCGRFTANLSLLYHEHEGFPPFHVLGPTLPPGWARGQTFSIYHRSRCGSREDLGRVVRHARKVEFLQLEDFDDDALASLPTFENMGVLELQRAKLRGPGLAGLSRQGQLRHVRIYLEGDGPFSAASLPPTNRLQTLTIKHLPAGSSGFSAIAKQTKLEGLTLDTDRVLAFDAALPRTLGGLTLRARSIGGDPLPIHVGSLGLHVRDAGDAEMERLLARVRSVTRLSLRGTPVSDVFLERIVSRWKLLQSLDVTDTRVGDECIRRVRAKYPKLRVHPRTESDG